MIDSMRGQRLYLAASTSFSDRMWSIFLPVNKEHLTYYIRVRKSSSHDPASVEWIDEGQIRLPAQTHSVEEPHLSALTQRKPSQTSYLMLLWEILSHYIRLGRGGKWYMSSCRLLQSCVCR